MAHCILEKNTIKKAILVAVASCALPAFSQTLIYENDFETPNNGDTCTSEYDYGIEAAGLTPNYDGTGTGNAAASVVFHQKESADKYCLEHANSTYKMKDPSGKAGKYAVYFQGSATVGYAEAFGFSLAPGSEKYLNFTFQVSNGAILKLGSTESAFSESVGSPVNLTINFYKLPVNEDFIFLPPPSVGGIHPVQTTLSTVTLTPIYTEILTLTNNANTGNPKVNLDFVDYVHGIDTSSFLPGEKVVIAFTGAPEHTGFIFDNFKITADPTINPTPNPTPNPTTPNSSSKSVPSSNTFSLLLLLVSLMTGAFWLSQRRLNR